MVVFIQRFSQHWYWIAALCGLLFLLFVRQALLIHREVKDSIFGLEREQGRKRIARARGRALLMLVIAGAAFATNTYLIPMLHLPQVEDRRPQQPPTVLPPTMTPTPGFPQPSALALVGLDATTATPGPSPTPTETATPATVEPSPTPTITPAPAPAVNQGVIISSPAPGETVRGVVAISGVANIPNFQFYKVEVGVGEQPSSWSVITDVHRQPVNGGLLQTWDTSPFPAGVYWLRLTVVDKTGNFPPPYSVRVIVAK